MAEKFVKWLFVGALVIYIFLFLWLFHRHFSPFGLWSGEIKAPKVQTRLMSGPTPEYRVEETEEKVWYIKETPVYFEVNNPRKFDRAELTFRFRGEAPIIEAGVVKSQDPWRVEMQTLYHEYLEKLGWMKLLGDDDDIMVWERKLRYRDLEEFWREKPPLEEIVVVDLSLPYFQSAKVDLNRSTGGHSYNVSLRGPQNLYLWANDEEEIKVRFLVQDMNRHDEPDPVRILLCASYDMCRGSKGAADGMQLPDDGEEWNSRKPSALREMSVALKAKSSGIYHLTFDASDDIFIRRIETSQRYMVFKGQLYLGDEVQYGPARGALTVYSNGQGFALRTPHPESVQEVEFVSTEALPPASRRQGLDIPEHNKQYTIQMPREVAGDVVAITTPKRDLIINSDGFFALSRDAFFLPEPIGYKSDLDLDRLGINYVLARYTPSKEKGDWREKTVTVRTWDANPATPLRVVLGTPIGGKQNFEISELRVRLTKPPLTWGKIWSRLKGRLTNYGGL